MFTPFPWTVSYFGSKGRHLDAATAVTYTRVSTIRLEVGYSGFRIVDIRFVSRIIRASYIQCDFNKSNICTPLVLSFPPI